MYDRVPGFCFFSSGQRSVVFYLTRLAYRRAYGLDLILSINTKSCTEPEIEEQQPCIAEFG